MSRPVVLRSYMNPNDAYAVRSLLEDAGIPVFLYDEYAPSTLPTPSSGVKIVVPEENVEEALQIIYQDHPTEFEGFPEVADEVLACPKCHSKRIHLIKNRLTLAKIIISLLLVLTTAGNQRNKYQCRDCRHTWRSY